MKRIVSFGVLACAVSSASFASAQTSQSKSLTSPVLSLGATQAEIDQPPVPPSSGYQIPDPFDLSEQSPSDVVQPAPDLDSTHQLGGTSARIEDPKSLAVGTNVRKPSVVDTMANYATLADMPHAGHGPVQWGYGMGQTPNPVAEAMLREYCVDGLWDGYADQRARECAEQWAHIHGLKQWGFRHHGACQHCGGNRYLSRDCDACDR